MVKRIILKGKHDSVNSLASQGSSVEFITKKHHYASMCNNRVLEAYRMPLFDPKVAPRYQRTIRNVNSCSFVIWQKFLTAEIRPSDFFDLTRVLVCAANDRLQRPHSVLCLSDSMGHWADVGIFSSGTRTTSYRQHVQISDFACSNNAGTRSPNESSVCDGNWHGKSPSTVWRC